MFCKGCRRVKLLALGTDWYRCRVELGRECYAGGKCVASELGKEQNVGQKKIVSFLFYSQILCYRLDYLIL